MSESKEWERIQERAFTKWVNSHLRKREMKVDSLIDDMENGVALINLYEIISDESLGKYYPDPKSKFHKIANLGTVLRKINSFVNSVGIKVEFSAEQVMEKDKRQILGMIWCLIHKFEIQDISEEELSAREGLLLWCKKKTQGYRNVKVDNFNTSWQDGLAFCALIHKHRPDLLDFDPLDKANQKQNLQLAFEVAEKHLGIPQLLDADDMVNYRPEDKSVMMYVAYYWKKFAAGNKAELAGKKISKITSTQKELEQLEHDYEQRATALDQWMDVHCEKLSDTSPEHFGNSLARVLPKSEQFKQFKDNEKPEKAKERVELELLLASIRTKQKSEGLPLYRPPEHLNTPQLSNKWQRLGQLQEEYDVALKAHIALMKRLEILYNRFVSRASKIQDWQNNKISGLQAEDVTQYDTVSSLQARLKVLETFFEEIASVEKSLNDTKEIGQQIVDANHEKAEEVSNTSNALTQGQAQVAELGNKFREDLAEQLKKLEEIIELSLELAKNNESLNMFLEDASLALAEPVSASNVEDVEHYFNNLSRIDEEHNSQQPLLARSRELDSWLRERNADPKAFSKFSVDEIEQRYNEVRSQIDSRREELNEEKIKQSKVSELLQEFSNLASSYKEFIEAQNAELHSESTLSLEEQLAELKVKGEAALVKNDEFYQSLRNAIEQLEVADVIEQTTVTQSEITTMYENLKTVVDKRTQDLENQILISKDQNITEEQLKEFQEAFRHFDKDRDGRINKLDFKSCCQSLGEDIPDNQLDKIFAEYDTDGDGHITFDELVNYMSKNLRVGSSYEDVIDAFSQLAGGKDYITEAQLRSVMDKSEADYLLSKMPKTDEGYDYKAYLNETFAKN
jgi:Ca2+-binding EF-hand superfamily protein